MFAALAAMWVSCGTSETGQYDPSGQPVDGGASVSGNGGYLFVHMTDQNYGRMFYSVSRDGLVWETLNDGKVILETYLGHPTLTRGGDGKYYMIGVSTGQTPHYPVLWFSDDLVVWGHRDLSPDIFDVSAFNYKNDTYYYGAPKVWYDSASGRYIITWHAGITGVDNAQEEWESKRTFYILTEDFETFTPADRLFDFTGDDADMATIDTIIEKEGDTYYAIIKDERWPDKCPTGKTIRIASSSSLTGPYTNPGPPVTPAWREAPSIVRSPDGQGWYLYTEQYPTTYELYKCSSLAGSMWSQVAFTPPVARHGWVMRIDETQYQAIVDAYGTDR